MNDPRITEDAKTGHPRQTSPNCRNKSFLRRENCHAVLSKRKHLRDWRAAPVLRSLTASSRLVVDFMDVPGITHRSHTATCTPEQKESQVHTRDTMQDAGLDPGHLWKGKKKRTKLKIIFISPD